MGLHPQLVPKGKPGWLAAADSTEQSTLDYHCHVLKTELALELKLPKVVKDLHAVPNSVDIC